MGGPAPPWYKSSIGPRLKPGVRNFYEKWSGLAGDELIAHLYQIRERAWTQKDYPCIGQWMFLLPSISRLPTYSEILKRVHSGDIALDLGCCFGQDLRLLAAEGCSPSQMYASDISSELWHMGFDLFRDRDRMLAKFVQADILDPDSGLKQLKGKVDVLIVNQLLHLFDWRKQIAAMKRIVEVSKPGSLVVGYQRAQVPPREIERPWGNMYFHDKDSMEKIWSKVGLETGTVWDVEAVLEDLSEWGMEEEDIDWMPEGRKGINFSARRRS